jgi:hypothetical protein
MDPATYGCGNAVLISCHCDLCLAAAPLRKMIPQCLDILVTQDGAKTEIVVGWMTNVMVLNAATI